MEKKLYQQMTPDEQLRYVTDLSAFIEKKLPVLEKLGDAWELSNRKDMETGLALIGAFQFARDFVDKTLRYGDYAARVYRLRVYFNKVKEEVGKGLSIKGSDGHTYALVAPSIPTRRRGRPTAAEAKARINGIEIAKPSDPEMEKQLIIARLMGIEVRVSNDAPREKNNAEIEAEKAAKRAEYEKQNPSLFPEDTQLPVVAKGASVTSAPGAAAIEVTTPPAGGAGQREGQSAEGGLPCPTMSEVYQDRIEQDRLRLSDLAWLCSDDLKKRIETVRGLRVTAESASERAKTMADMGASPDQIAPYAQQAKEAVEGYMAIYQAVDEELAIQFKRLSIDLPYIERFKTRFKGVELEKVLHICRPYYEKVKKDDPTIDERIKSAIEQDNPEYAAKLAKEKAEKEEVQAINRYLKRTDKPASDERVKTMKERIERLRELRGDEFADAYLPILNKTIEANAALHQTAESGSAGTSANPAPKEQKRSAKKPTAKEPAAKKK